MIRRRPRRKINLGKTLFILPNLITMASVFCGCYAITLCAERSSEDALYRAALYIIFAMFFDMLDGRVARATRTQSAFGLQIDSLADVVSFGVAPAQLVYHWSLYKLGGLGLAISFLFTACGAIRLARFNVLSMGEQGKPLKPSKYILGLPIPGAAGILVSIVVSNRAASNIIDVSAYAWVVAIVTMCLAAFMVSTIRFRSFKDVRLNARTAALVFFAVGTSIAISLKATPAFVLVWLLCVYVGLGVIESTWMLLCRLTGRPVPRDSVAPAPPPAAP